MAETLRKAMAGPMPAKEAVPIAITIAAALADGDEPHGALSPDTVEVDDEEVSILEAAKGGDRKDTVRAFGALLYEMLTATKPEGDEPDAPSAIAKATPPGLDAFVMGCLAADYTDATAMLAALRAVDLSDAKAARVKKEREATKKRLDEEKAKDARPEIPQPEGGDATPKTSGGKAASFLPIVVLVVAVGGILFYMKREQSKIDAADGGAPPQTHPGPPGRPNAKGLLALAPPKCSDAANTEVKAGREALRQSGNDAAEAHFRAASKVDPTCAEAHLRIAMLAQTYQPDEARAELALAKEHAAKLSPRDKELMAALEPSFTAAEPNLNEVRQRMKTLAASTHNDDAEVLVEAAEHTPADPIYAMSTARLATKIDPGYGDAWLAYARAAQRGWELASAEDALAKCVQNAPNDVDCVVERAELMSRLGQCSELLNATNAQVEKVPALRPRVSAALATKGEVRNVVEGTLAPYFASLAPSRDFEKPLRTALLAVFYGDFAKAREEIDALGRLVEPRKDLIAHGAYALAHIALLEEIGDEAGVKRFSEETAKKVPGWVRPGRVPRTAWGVRYLEPRLASLVPSMKDALLEKWKRPVRGGDLDVLAAWAYGDGMLAASQHDAAEAIVRLPHLTKDHPSASPIADYIAGKTQLLARRPAHAELWLKNAIARCDASEYPFEHVRAHEQLGEVYEYLRRPSEACASYGNVVLRWGGAKDSVTAKKAKERMTVLKCAVQGAGDAGK